MNHHFTIIVYQPVTNPQSWPLTSRFNEPIDLFPMFFQIPEMGTYPGEGHIYIYTGNLHIYIVCVYVCMYIYIYIHLCKYTLTIMNNPVSENPCSNLPCSSPRPWLASGKAQHLTSKRWHFLCELRVRLTMIWWNIYSWLLLIVLSLTINHRLSLNNHLLTIFITEYYDETLILTIIVKYL